MPPSRNILEALFDIRPITRSGSLDFEKIGKVKGRINLKKKKIVEIETVSIVKKPPLKKPLSREGISREFERTIAEPVNVAVELARFGGKLHDYVRKERPVEIEPQPEEKIVVESRDLENFWKREDLFEQSEAEREIETEAEPKIEPEIALAVAESYHSPAEREIEAVLDLYRRNKISVVSSPKPEEETFHQKKPKTIRYAMIALGLLVLLGASFAYRGGEDLKNNVMVNGGKAVANLEQAKANLTNFNFANAADNFASAYDDFGSASGNLNSMGASFLSNFSDLPGLSKVKSANNLVLAGQHISKAGENLALAFSTLSETNFLGNNPLSKLVSEFKQVLVNANANITDANNLVADIDASALPTDKQQLFIDFKAKIPEFQQYIGNAIDYSDFLSGVIGGAGKTEKKYLMLLQNTSELRATGGFPGSYALVTFENGSLKSVSVDDVYNIDGQLKVNIIPPIPLQAITPNWGMRDANWFADFPASAKKVEEFYKMDTAGATGTAGDDIDGVFSITPQVIGQILDVIGGLDMPAYGIKLDSKNFITQIQSQVEYGANRSQPKTIVKDLQPLLFAKLAAQDSSKWADIFKILVQAVGQKQILAYFNDAKLENMALQNGLGGEVRTTADDYLQVVFSNIKGSKTDAVIDDKFDLKTDLTGGTIANTLTITRTHNGGDSQYGFYNKVSPTYVRVYAPLGSVLGSVTGDSITDYHPLIGYADYNFKTDPDLGAVEDTIIHPFKGVDVFEESGKTVFGFWLVLDPKQTKSVTVSYISSVPVTPDSYGLLWQKQSGTGSDPISFQLTLPEGEKVVNSDGSLNATDNGVTIKSDLSVDREANVNFK
jgi:hypothetical protein